MPKIKSLKYLAKCLVLKETRKDFFKTRIGKETYQYVLHCIFVNKPHLAPDGFKPSQYPSLPESVKHLFLTTTNYEETPVVETKIKPTTKPPRKRSSTKDSSYKSTAEDGEGTTNPPEGGTL